MSNTQASIERHDYFVDAFHFSYSRFTEAIERERASEEEREGGGEGGRVRVTVPSPSADSNVYLAVSSSLKSPMSLKLSPTHVSCHAPPHISAVIQLFQHVLTCYMAATSSLTPPTLEYECMIGRMRTAYENERKYDKPSASRRRVKDIESIQHTAYGIEHRRQSRRPT